MTTNDYTSFQKRIIRLYVEHPEVKKVWDRLDERRWNRNMALDDPEEFEESPQNLFITGKSRVGKTQIMKRYARRNPKYTIVEKNGTEVDIVPVAYVKLPHPFTPTGFYQNIIKALGANRPTGEPKVEKLQHRAYELIKRQKVEMIIFDELDYLLGTTYVSKKNGMEFIKDIENEARVCVVCVGTPDTEELRKINDQIMGRFPPLTIPWFKECDDSFIDLLKEIENQLNSKVPLGLSERDSAFPQLLHMLSGGLVGWLKPILREAFRIVGILSPGFNDFSLVNKINGDILLEARERALGEMSQEELEFFLEDKKQKGEVY